YKVIILPLDVTQEAIINRARQVHELLEKEGISVLLDDRDERAGVKFKDADLLGVSLQVIIGKEGIKNNTLELKIRRGAEKISGAEDLVFGKIKEFCRNKL
ncbi:MAG: His/Gly/Thr/Pro-type tRNA ligase C-terminal domain-containing protein, partial [Candidatus Omnitrophica bacterium]|nr:His/Gly/Thr/Pro-type tRNA ligase C-terminal domain-containing protein [Candidatus Omnitrophota bacterium]